MEEIPWLRTRSSLKAGMRASGSDLAFSIMEKGVGGLLKYSGYEEVRVSARGSTLSLVGCEFGP